MAGPCYYEADMEIALNDDWIVSFQYYTMGLDGVTLTPVDLTGSELKLEIRVNESDNEAIVSVFSPDPNGISVPDPTTGEFTIAISRGLLWRLFPGAFYVDFVRLMPSGYQERIFEGTATVVTGTTR